MAGRVDTRAERAAAAAQVPTRQQRLDAIVKVLRGDAPDPTDDYGRTVAPWRFIEHIDGEIELQVETADGDRLVGRGPTNVAALKALEAKVQKREA